MTAAKNVYALMLALVIVLSGCFGNTANDTNGQDVEETTESTGNQTMSDSTAPDNKDPQIYYLFEWQHYGIYNDAENGSYTITHLFNFSWEISVLDFDGNITTVGLDTTLDGQIDIEFNSSNWSDFTHQNQSFNLVDMGVESHLDTPTYFNDGMCMYRFNLIAVDDDGGISLEPMTLKIGQELYCQDTFQEFGISQ